MTWRTWAKCRDYPIGWWFPELGGSYTEARQICNACPVKRACGDEAMRVEADIAYRIRYGMFGGMTPYERWQLDYQGRAA